MFFAFKPLLDAWNVNILYWPSTFARSDKNVIRAFFIKANSAARKFIFWNRYVLRFCINRWLSNLKPQPILKNCTFITNIWLYGCSVHCLSICHYTSLTLKVILSNTNIILGSVNRKIDSLSIVVNFKFFSLMEAIFNSSFWNSSVVVCVAVIALWQFIIFVKNSQFSYFKADSSKLNDVAFFHIKLIIFYFVCNYGLRISHDEPAHLYMVFVGVLLIHWLIMKEPILSFFIYQANKIFNISLFFSLFCSQSR